MKVLDIQTVHFISLSDVLDIMGVSRIIDGGDPFDGVSFGDASYTIMSTRWVLDTLEDYMEVQGIEIDWDKWNKKCDQLTDEVGADYVDMES
jgi:hypothetical protein